MAHPRAIVMKSHRPVAYVISWGKRAEGVGENQINVEMSRSLFLQPLDRHEPEFSTAAIELGERSFRISKQQGL